MINVIKKTAAFLLCLCILFGLCSCSGGKEPEETTNENTEKVTDSDTVENTKDPLPEPESFELSLVITYSDKDKTYVLPKNCIANTYTDGNAVISGTDNTEINKIADAVLPFGVKIGDKFSDVCEKFSLGKGYAVYGEVGTSSEIYDPDDIVDFSEGNSGSLYFGYKVIDGECVAIDASMLKYIISGQLLSSYDFDIVMFSMSFDSNECLTYACQVYSEFEVFGNIMNGK
ncbi:MAG: hypothetical protein PUC29_03655 [Clostridia bacterium]|nr:hypothetical protein [Clostridia bacterium]